MIQEILRLLKEPKFNLQDEKFLQQQVAEHLANRGIVATKELKLGSKDVIDFLIGNIGIEVKIQGGRRSIYRQICRYCEYQEIQKIILLTNISMGLPEQIKGKDCYVVNLGKAWL